MPLISPSFYTLRLYICVIWGPDGGEDVLLGFDSSLDETMSLSIFSSEDGDIMSINFFTLSECQGQQITDVNWIKYEGKNLFLSLANKDGEYLDHRDTN